MPLRFILGLVIGSGAVIAYNKRKEIGSLLQQGAQNEHAQKVMNDGQNLITQVKSSIIKPKQDESNEDNNENNKETSPQDKQQESQTLC